MKNKRIVPAQMEQPSDWLKEKDHPNIATPLIEEGKAILPPEGAAILDAIGFGLKPTIRIFLQALSRTDP